MVEKAATVPELSKFEKADLDFLEAKKIRDEAFLEAKTEAIEKIKVLIAKFQISVNELTDDVKIKEPKPQTVKIEAGKTFIFEGETWISGKRGKRPLWVSQAIEKGTLKKLEVK